MPDYILRLGDSGSVAVGRWTRDQEIAGSTPTAALFGQQPRASCSHLIVPLFTKQYNLVPCEGLHAKSAVLLAAA